MASFSMSAISRGETEKPEGAPHEAVTVETSRSELADAARRLEPPPEEPKRKRRKRSRSHKRKH